MPGSISQYIQYSSSHVRHFFLLHVWKCLTPFHLCSTGPTINTVARSHRARERERDTYLNYSSEGEKKRLKSTLHLGYTDEQCGQARQLVFFSSQLLFPVCTLGEHDHQQMDNGKLSFTYHVDWSTVIPAWMMTKEHKIWKRHWEHSLSRVLMLMQTKNRRIDLEQSESERKRRNHQISSSYSESLTRLVDDFRGACNGTSSPCTPWPCSAIGSDSVIGMVLGLSESTSLISTLELHKGTTITKEIVEMRSVLLLQTSSSAAERNEELNSTFRSGFQQRDTRVLEKKVWRWPCKNRKFYSFH